MRAEHILSKLASAVRQCAVVCARRVGCVIGLVIAACNSPVTQSVASSRPPAADRCFFGRDEIDESHDSSIDASPPAWRLCGEYPSGGSIDPSRHSFDRFNSPSWRASLPDA